MSRIRKYTIAPRKLQHIYDRHAREFGVRGPKNPARLAALHEAIQAQLEDQNIPEFKGHYRGNPAVLHYSNKTGNVIVVDQSNNVVAGFKLSAAQAAYVQSTGRLN